MRKIMIKHELTYFTGGVISALAVTWTLALLGVPPIGLNEFLSADLPAGVEDNLFTTMLCDQKE